MDIDEIYLLNRLFDYLKKQGISDKKFCHWMNISPNTMVRWRQGKPVSRSKAAAVKDFLSARKVDISPIGDNNAVNVNSHNNFFPLPPDSDVKSSSDASDQLSRTHLLDAVMSSPDFSSDEKIKFYTFIRSYNET